MWWAVSECEQQLSAAQSELQTHSASAQHTSKVVQTYQILTGVKVSLSKDAKTAHCKAVNPALKRGTFFYMKLLSGL